MRPSSIPEAIAQLGIDGREQEGEIVARCPLHTDSSPSFAINTETGLWICYAGCGSGNISQLAANVLNISGTDLTNWTRKLGLNQVQVLHSNPDQKWDVVSEEHLIAITQRPPADMLTARGISEQAAEELGIRFNPWNPAKETGKPGTDPCWMIPIRNPHDHTLIGWQTKGTTGDRQALTTGRKGWTLFGIELVERDKDIVVVESPLDVAHARSLGFTNWVALFGSAISVQQIELLADLLSDGGRLIIATDNPALDTVGKDGIPVGEKAARKLMAAKALKGVPKLRFKYHESAKDPGDMDGALITRGLEEAS